MKLSGAINGVARLAGKLKKLDVDLNKASERSLKEVTLLVHETAVKSIQANTDGTPVTRYNPKRERFAAFPGDPPNTDTGALARSIKFEFAPDFKFSLIGTNLIYGKHLEFNNHPWLAPALKAASALAAEIYIQNLNDVIKKETK